MKYVLFVCNHNAGRSQMAQAFFDRRAPSGVREIRADRTCHERRLERLLPVLSHEFAGRRSEGEVRACADAVLGEYEEVPVRGFVETVALRRIRSCLREERCVALSAG